MPFLRAAGKWKEIANACSAAASTTCDAKAQIRWRWVPKVLPKTHAINLREKNGERTDRILRPLILKCQVESLVIVESLVMRELILKEMSNAIFDWSKFCQTSVLTTRSFGQRATFGDFPGLSRGSISFSPFQCQNSPALAEPQEQTSGLISIAHSPLDLLRLVKYRLVVGLLCAQQVEYDL